LPIVMLLMGMVMAIIIVVLALQNGRVVNVSFFDWSVEASLVLVIMVSAFMGFLTALFLELFIQLKLRYRLFRLGHQVKQLEEELQKIKKPISTIQPGDETGVGT
jgi:lipopolysaccharide assembly protein A